MFQTDQPTAASSLPIPAAAGTAGYFTNGNPATGVAATIVDADWLNMLQQELLNIVTASGITPSKTTYNQVLAAIKRIGQNTVVLTDTGAVNAYAATNATPLVAGTWVDGVVQAVKIAHTNTGASTYAPDGLSAIPIYGLGLQPLQGNELLLNGTAILMHATIAGVNSGNPVCVLMECAGGAQQIPAATQPLHAVQLGQVGHGQCRLTVLNSTTLQLIPYGGNNLVINGVPQPVPVTGVTVTNGGLIASAWYYVYAYMSAGVMALECSSTIYALSNAGIRVKSGDATRTLVGAIYTTSVGTNFADSPTQRFCLSMYNRSNKYLANAISNSSFTNTVMAEVTTALRCQFISWGDESVSASVDGEGASNTNGGSVLVQCYIDATAGSLSGTYFPNANTGGPIISLHGLNAAEGSLHYVTAYGSVNSGAGTLLQGYTRGMIRG